MEVVQRVALYARVSTEEQKNHGYSIAAQMDELRAYARDNQFEVVGEYIDEGFSGGTIKRPALQKLLSDIEDHLIDIVVFVKLDRWFRSVSQYYKIQEVLDTNFVNWICTQEDYETITSSGKFKVNIMLSVSQQFKDATSERIKSVIDYKVKNGYYTTRCVPIGFALKREAGGNRVIINKAEEAIVKDLINIYRECGSMRYTIKVINQKYNTNISRKNIETLFKSPLLHGEYRGIQDFCKGYLTKEEHEALLKCKVDCRHTTTTAKYDYIFRGLLVCPECGNKLIGSKHHSGTKNNHKYIYPIYRCNKARSNESTCGFKQYTYESSMERAIVEEVRSTLTDYIGEINVKNNVNLYKLKKQDVTKKIKKLNSLYMKTDMSEKEYEFELKNLNEIMNVLDNEDISRHVQVYRQLSDAKNEHYYFEMSNKEKRDFWHSVIRSIDVWEDKSIEIHYLYM